MTRQPLVHADQQAIVLRIPPRSSLKVDGDWEGADTRGEWACLGGGAIQVFDARATLRVVKDAKWGGGGGVAQVRVIGARLVDVEKTAMMNTADVQAADTDRGFRQRLKFDSNAGLDAIGILVVLVEADHHRRAEEGAT